MVKQNFKNIAVVVWLVLSSVGAVADEHEITEAHDGEEESAKNALATFIGVTLEGDESLGTLGIEYSYRVNKFWSLGGVIERAERESDSTLVIVFAHFWPYKELYLGAGVGRKDPEDERENTFRATIGYEFELAGGWSISPQANLDVIEGHENEEVYGIAIGKRF